MKDTSEVKFKLDTKLDEMATDGLEAHVEDLYSQRGHELVGIVTFQSVDRSQPTADSGLSPYVKVRLTSVEIATPAQSEALRKMARKMFDVRQADGEGLPQLTVRMEGQAELF